MVERAAGTTSSVWAREEDHRASINDMRGRIMRHQTKQRCSAAVTFLRFFEKNGVKVHNFLVMKPIQVLETPAASFYCASNGPQRRQLYTLCR